MKCKYCNHEIINHGEDWIVDKGVPDPKGTTYRYYYGCVARGEDGDEPHEPVEKPDRFQTLYNKLL